MNIRKKSVVFTFGVILVINSIAFSNGKGLENKIDDFVKPLLKNRVFNGCLLIAEGNEIKLQKCYGKSNYETGLENKPNSQFRIASLSKSFTEIAIELLVQRNRLTKSDKLSKYYSDIKGAEKITINHLLNNRSGIPHLNNFPNYDDLAKKNYTLQEVIDLFKDKDLEFEPGTKRQYSNSGFVLLTYIVEKVSGKNYSEFLEENVFRVAGMKHSLIEKKGKTSNFKAFGYQPHPWKNKMMKSLSWQPDIKIGGGDITSTPEDIYRFLKHYYQGKFGIEPEIPKEKKRVHFFQGNSPGFASYAEKHFDRDIYVVVLANNYSRAGWKIGKTIGKIYKKEDVKPLKFPQRYKGKMIDGFVGKHKFGSWNFQVIKKGKNKYAVATINNGKPDRWRTSKVYPISENSIFLPWYIASMTFVKKSDGTFDFEWKNY